MIVTDEFVFLQLQKCASTRIAQIIEQEFAGQRYGRHERFRGDANGRKFLGSVRSPWSWYVSLWAAGCGGKSRIYKQLTRADKSSSPMRRAWEFRRDLSRRPGAVARSIRAGLRTDVDYWKDLYRDADDTERFREWLAAIHQPENALILDPRYGASPLSDHAGLYSFRYLYLFGQRESAFLRTDQLSLSDLDEFRDRHIVCDRIVRIEHLRDELVEALAALAPRSATPERLAAVGAASDTPFNTSRHRPFTEFYDQASIRLVGERDALVSSAHGYAAPASPTD